MEFHLTLGTPAASIAWAVWIQIGITAVIAAAGVFIAARQAINAEHKTRLDLYDRRYQIYLGVTQAATKVVFQNKQQRPRKPLIVRSLARRSQFLFDKPIVDKIEQIHDECVRVDERWAQLWYGPRRCTPDQRNDVLHEEYNAIDNLLAEMRELMMPFLDFRELGDVRAVWRISHAIKKLKSIMDSPA